MTTSPVLLNPACHSERSEESVGGKMYIMGDCGFFTALRMTADRKAAEIGRQVARKPFQHV